MYLARFAGDPASYRLSAAFSWPVRGDTVLPPGWSGPLLAGDVDIALRVSGVGDSLRGLLLLSAVADREEELRQSCRRLLEAPRPEGLHTPDSPAAFDAETSSVLPPWQVRVQHGDFHHEGHPLACSFRLYGGVAAQPRLAGAGAYQLHLRAHRPDRALERRVRKYLAWLDLEQPFTPQVCAMQNSLVRALLEPGWLGAEYLAINEAVAGQSWLTGMRDHFAETTGRLGFPDPPVEIGDFSDWLTTGFHPASDPDWPSALAPQGASVFTRDEITWLFSGAFVRGQVSGRRQSAPQVFISYASPDFALAAQTCRALEDNGLVCWIAPRDIVQSAEPYPIAIEKSLAQTRAVVVLISDAANRSVHIPRELDLALERKQTIVPLRLASIAPSGQLNYLLRTCQWVDAFERDFGSAVGELLARLHKAGGGRALRAT